MESGINLLMQNQLSNVPVCLAFYDHRDTSITAFIYVHPVKGGGALNQNGHTFGPKFAFQNRTLTVQWISMKNHTLKVQKGENFCNFPRKCGIVAPRICQFCANFTKILAFDHNFLPLQCTSWTLKNLSLRAERLVGPKRSVTSGRSFTLRPLNASRQSSEIGRKVLRENI